MANRPRKVFNIPNLQGDASQNTRGTSSQPSCQNRHIKTNK